MAASKSFLVGTASNLRRENWGHMQAPGIIVEARGGTKGDRIPLIEKAGKLIKDLKLYVEVAGPPLRRSGLSWRWIQGRPVFCIRMFHGYCMQLRTRSSEHNAAQVQELVDLVRQQNASLDGLQDLLDKAQREQEEFERQDRERAARQQKVMTLMRN